VSAALTILQHQVLTALAEGYAARQGMKDRIRALNEWEIARRSGLTQASYAEYLTHPTREEIGAALTVLQRLGLASVWDHGAKYDTFVPTAAGTDMVTGSGALQTTDPVVVPGDGSAPRAPEPTDSVLRDAIVERLDEVILLLRSIDARLEGGR
jgi:hypothetical protein